MLASPARPLLQVPVGDLEVRANTSQESGVRSQESVASSLTPDSCSPTPDKVVTLADAERDHILGVLRETGWVLGGPNGAAARLGMKRTTLQSKMKKLCISRPSER